jgi:hypothetical protein
MMDSDMRKQATCWIIAILCLFQGIACSTGNGKGSTPKSDKMEEKKPIESEVFNLSYYQEIIEKYNDGSDKGAIYTDTDGTQVYVLLSTEYYFLQQIKRGSFMESVRIYYKNLYLKEELTLMYMSSTVLLGMHREYDEQGYLIKETDEDKKFEGLLMKPMDILKYLQCLGYLNLKTGEGEERFDRNGQLNIFFSESPKKKSIFDKREPAVWVIDFFHNGRLITHTINAETGEVMSIKEEFMEE